jgi:hypothetical protein
MREVQFQRAFFGRYLDTVEQAGTHLADFGSVTDAEAVMPLPSQIPASAGIFWLRT